jgi:hypothetical protein
MQAIRQIETFAGSSVVVPLPESFRRRRIEIIVIPMDEADSATRPLRRSPPVFLVGKGKIIGDIISPAIPETDWDCLHADH